MYSLTLGWVPPYRTFFFLDLEKKSGPWVKKKKKIGSQKQK
jgi:hypothetical protein